MLTGKQFYTMRRAVFNGPIFFACIDETVSLTGNSFGRVERLAGEDYSAK
jgi:hypothetical protein